MNKVQIICDSTLDITPELYKKYDIDVIPLHVSFGDEDYLDGQNITLEELYKKVKEYGKLPQTAAVSSAIFEEEFKKFIDKGMDVVYVGIGSTLSSAFQSAYIAKQSFPEGRVALIDSKNLSSASAVKSALRGKPLSAIDGIADIPYAMFAAAPVYKDGALAGVIVTGYDFAADTEEGDSLQSVVQDSYGVEFTIFKDNIRVATTIKAENGKNFL